MGFFEVHETWMLKRKGILKKDVVKINLPGCRYVWISR